MKIVISLGAGLQSTALCYMSEYGMLPRADAMVFADTHAEPDWVYETLEQIKRDINIPLHVVSLGDIIYDSINNKRYSSPPFFIETEGGPMPLRRQCTADYKILPVRRFIKKEFGGCELWLGISMDEMNRARFSQVRYIKNVYPLLDNRMTRQDCAVFLESKGVRVPQKSSCYFCPFHNDYYWMFMKREHPDLFEKACMYDEAIRDRSQLKDGKKQYLHRSLKPLRDVEFKHDKQYTLEFVCSGGCGV